VPPPVFLSALTRFVYANARCGSSGSLIGQNSWGNPTPNEEANEPCNIAGEGTNVGAELLAGEVAGGEIGNTGGEGFVGGESGNTGGEGGARRGVPLQRGGAFCRLSPSCDERPAVLSALRVSLRPPPLRRS